MRAAIVLLLLAGACGASSAEGSRYERPIPEDVRRAVSAEIARYLADGAQRLTSAECADMMPPSYDASLTAIRIEPPPIGGLIEHRAEVQYVITSTPECRSMSPVPADCPAANRTSYTASISFVPVSGGLEIARTQELPGMSSHEACGPPEEPHDFERHAVPTW